MAFLPQPHARLLDIALPACRRHGLVLAGGYAIQAHGLVERQSEDLDLATSASAPLEEIAHDLANVFRAAGFTVDIVEATPRMARLHLLDSDRSPWEIDLLKEAFYQQPVWMDVGPVLGRDDAVGLKVRALHDRGLARDFIDVYAATRHYETLDLEHLGARHDEEFSLQGLQQRIAGLEFIDDTELLAYGLNEEKISAIRSWAFTWQEDLGERLAEQAAFDEQHDDSETGDHSDDLRT